MKELVFLLEEASAGAMLQGLLPRVLDPRVQLRLMVFEGKQDLERQMVKRLRGYLNPQARFIVLRDQDSTPDCKVVKAKLLALCGQAGRDAVSLVRIACHELESFYIGDLRAVEAALGLTGLVRHQGAARFRNADRIESPRRELAKLTRGAYQKVSGSRQIGPHLDLANERSASFKHLVAGVRRLEQELLALPDGQARRSRRVVRVDHAGFECMDALAVTAVQREAALLLVAVRKRAFLAAAGCKDTRNELAALVHPIPSSSDTNAGLSTAAADAPHRQGGSPQ